MSQAAGITVAGLTVVYRNGHKALQNASFSVPKGSNAALLGVMVPENPHYSGQ